MRSTFGPAAGVCDDRLITLGRLLDRAASSGVARLSSTAHVLANQFRLKYVGNDIFRKCVELPDVVGLLKFIGCLKDSVLYEERADDGVHS